MHCWAPAGARRHSARNLEGVERTHKGTARTHAQRPLNARRQAAPDPGKSDGANTMVQVPKALAQRVEIRHALAIQGRNQPLYHVRRRTGLAGAAAGSPASAVGYFADAAQSFVGVAEASDVWRVSSGSGVSGLMMSAIAAPGGGETLARRGAARARGSGSSRTASARRSRRVGVSPAEPKKVDDIGAKRDEISAWVDRVVLSERPMTTGGTPSGSPATGSRPHATASQCRSLTSMCAPHRREMAQLQWRLA